MISAEEMKKTAIALSAAVGIAAAIVAFLPRERKVIISDFSWSVSGKTAPYSFSVSNQTDEKLTVVVVLEAHRIIQGRDGNKLHPLGLAKAEVSLMGRETKKEDGELELLDFGNSETRVSYHASIKENSFRFEVRH
jgi:hypothetical protein